MFLQLLKANPNRHPRTGEYTHAVGDGGFPKVTAAAGVIPIKKADDTGEKRMVWAEVYVPMVPDSDGDFMDAPTIERMAYKFMKELRLKSVDTQHDNVNVDGASVVESFIARKGDPDFVEGAWVVGMHIDNEVTWGKIKKGEINGFSMEALVTRNPMEIELEIPDMIRGITTKHGAGDEAHEHDFYVTYDAEANLVGGRTSPFPGDGHYHIIKRGTLTEGGGKDGHQHRFSFVEGLIPSN